MTVRYLLDTNICIYIAKYNPPAVRERFAQHSMIDFVLCDVAISHGMH